MTSVPETTQSQFGALEVEGVDFAPSVTALGSDKQLVLGGAGFRGLEINGNLVKFTSIAIYVEKTIIPHLSSKLGGKSVEQLCENELLSDEVIAAPCEKLVWVAFLVPLSGPQYSEKVVEGIRLQANPPVKEETLKQYLELLKSENFPPGTSLLTSLTEEGVKIAFMKGNVVPSEPCAVINDKDFGRAFLRTIIGKNGVSPQAKVSLAQRLCKHL